MSPAQPQPRPDLLMQVPRGTARILGQIVRACQRYPLRPLPGMRGAAFSWLAAADGHLYRARRGLHTTDYQQARAHLVELAALTVAALSTLDQLTNHDTRT